MKYEKFTRMNQTIKLRNYWCFIRKFNNSNAFRNYHRSHVYNSSYCILQNVQLIKTGLRPFPDYSFCQVCEFAKRAQGKMMKSGKSKVLQLSDEEMADVIDVADYRERLNLVVEKLKKDYVENLSSRSAAANIDKIIVKIDNEEYPLNELAVISKKNQNLIAINMADFPEGLKPAIQAIMDSSSGLNPQQEGTMIYVTVPKMTREHRENLAKHAKSVYMKAKDEIRFIQNSFVKDAKDKTELSEDLVFSAANQIKMMADHCAADLEKVMKTKQKELLGEN